MMNKYNQCDLGKVCDTSENSLVQIEAKNRLNVEAHISCRPTGSPCERAFLKEIQGVPGAKYDDSTKQVLKETLSLPSGSRILTPARNAKQEILSAEDLRSILDGGGLWRLRDNGVPHQAALAGEDPRVIVREAEAALVGDFKPENHAAFSRAIVAADSLDRVAILKRIEENKSFLDKVSRAAALHMRGDELWGSYLELFGPLRDQDQLVALRKISKQVPLPKPGKTGWQELEQWLARPENTVHKQALEKHPNWHQVKSALVQYVACLAEIEAEPSLKGDLGDLDKNTRLKAEINEARARKAETESLEQLFRSSLTVRFAYLEKLSQQDDVKRYMALPADQKQTTPLKENLQVKAAQDLVRQLASQDRKLKEISPTNLAGLSFLARAVQLGVTRLEGQQPAKN